MGRGNYKGHRVIYPADDPRVKIGISISTTPANLDPLSQEPFYITFTARILETDRPGEAITLWTHGTPLLNITRGALEDIKCTTSDKTIKIYASHLRIQYHFRGEDLHRDDHITIPAQGSISVKHAVPKEAIESAHVCKGEHYRISFLLPQIGTKWWCYGTLDDLKDTRLRFWRPATEFLAESDVAARVAKERLELYGNGPSTMGEKPDQLALVAENEAEFEIAAVVDEISFLCA